MTLGQNVRPDLQRADALFDKGDFAEAEKIYRDAVNDDPQNYAATLKLGNIALLGNRYREAEDFLKKAMALNPAEAAPKAFLAEIYYRQDRFAEAAPLFRAAGKDEKAQWLESFKNRIANQIEPGVNETSVKFEAVDPLPIIKMKINGREAEFLIDTGGAELGLDSEWAKELGVEKAGKITVNFAGGVKGEINLGLANEAEIGGFKIKNVPVTLDSMDMTARMFKRPIKGVVGTVFLYHFLSTLDYPAGKLVLRKRTAENSALLAKDHQRGGAYEMPFWLAGQHVIVAKGSVNDSPEYLFFLDTGMGGGGLAVSPEFAAEAKIPIPKDEGRGIGGSGRAVPFKPIVGDEVRLGQASERNIRGACGGLHTNDEYRSKMGFRIVGIISHEFFKPYRLTFDFEAMKAYLAK